MRRTGLATALYVVLVFLSGAAVGAFGHRLYLMSTVKAESRPSPEEFRRRYVEEMRTRLNLSADQLAKLNEILDSTRARFRASHERRQPEMKAIQDEQVSKIRSILTDAQRAEYEKLRAEREQRRQKRMRPPGGGC